MTDQKPRKLRVGKSGVVPSWELEDDALRDGFKRIAGVDEAGRGPIAGPVAAAAVILPPDRALPWLARVNDSKVLTAPARERLAQRIIEECIVGTALVPPDVIDDRGIAAATRLAMVRAVEALLLPPDLVLVDGLFPLSSEALPSRPVVHGDGRSLSIAAASIIAKVVRDRVMRDLDIHFHGYGLARNKGYATKDHLDALERLGPTIIHRRSFAPIRQDGLSVDITDDA